jgi:steroid delta-isomerase-like uncharacterized protein
MSVEENKELIRRYFALDAKQFREILTSGKDEFHSPQFVVHSPRGTASLADFMKGLDNWFSAFPDLKWNIDDIVAEGEKIVVRYSFGGTHCGTFMGVPASGKKIKVDSVYVYKVGDGKLVEGWGVADSLGLMQQLGVIPKQ